ncbi:hypothetical protein CRUP_003741 [Coryphaenoides rupestris]|nr:hypothetical protein CRUP_003741 [Coryphaenoides rupestris]
MRGEKTTYRLIIDGSWRDTSSGSPPPPPTHPRTPPPPTNQPTNHPSASFHIRSESGEDRPALPTTPAEDWAKQRQWRTWIPLVTAMQDAFSAIGQERQLGPASDRRGGRPECGEELRVGELRRETLLLSPCLLKSAGVSLPLPPLSMKEEGRGRGAGSSAESSDQRLA